MRETRISRPAPTVATIAVRAASRRPLDPGAEM
jgi:hypothetical protein